MTDISDQREGDEIEAVIRLRVAQDLPVALSAETGATFCSLEFLKRVATSVTVVRPEIIPGQPYVDADGKLYIGRKYGRVTSVDGDNHVTWFGGQGNYDEGQPLPAGLRPAKVVPE